jgi:phosphate transport system permease protein
MAALAWVSVLTTAGAMAVFIGFLLARGAEVLGPELFFGAADPLAVLAGRAVAWDGIWSACLGTLALLGLACLLALPVGLAGGVYLAEYARGRWARLASLGVDVLAGTPSVLMGLFGFTLILFLRRTVWPQANTCLLVAAGCLALLVLPCLVNATRLGLEGLAPSLRLIGPSLGLTRWQSVRHVLLPRAGRAILGGVVLAMGRAAEDTAVILLTGAVANAGPPAGLLGRFEALPFFIFYQTAQHQTPRDLDLAVGAALVLLALTSGLSLGVRRLHRAALGPGVPA